MPNDYRPPTVCPLATDAAEVDIPGIRSDLQHRSAPIELTFSSHCFRAIRSTFTGHANIGEVAVDGVAIGHFDLRSNGDRQVIRKIDSDVAGRGFERRSKWPMA